MSRKFPIVAFALVLGFTLFAVQEFQTIDEQLAENDEAMVRISVAAPCLKEPPESSHRTFVTRAATNLLSWPRLMVPAKAGRKLLNLLTLQKK